MDSNSKEIILRHLKGIVNELEKDLKRQKLREEIDLYEQHFDTTGVKQRDSRPVVKL